MATLKEKAIGYVPKQTKNIAELPEVSVSVEIYDDGEGTDSSGKEFHYSYIELNGEEYRVPDSVVAQIQTQLTGNPELKRFRVKRTGEGLKTRYTVIPLT